MLCIHSQHLLAHQMIGQISLAEENFGSPETPGFMAGIREIISEDPKGWLGTFS
tara:strand:- start:505 stop:666 length:162 start_codon:yes stop_codon:yes gene_type:complete